MTTHIPSIFVSKVSMHFTSGFVIEALARYIIRFSFAARVLCSSPECQGAPTLCAAISACPFPVLLYCRSSRGSLVTLFDTHPPCPECSDPPHLPRRAEVAYMPAPARPPAPSIAHSARYPCLQGI